MASDRDSLRESALAKVGEFKKLGYPLGVLRKACALIDGQLAETTFLRVYP